MLKKGHPWQVDEWNNRIDFVRLLKTDSMELQKHKSVSDDVKFMMDRFSAYKDQILDAYQSDEEFKTLCEDFYASALILENVKRKLLKDKRSELEYRKLFLDLEGEILNFLGTDDNV
jgi:hypothetical protein